ncbi:diguanylate cyclase [Candidatus Methylospira mobilis]|uniref:diguanylate cyclase n=1 Tax=Candidatus Methylospira mobilis TaxID=1808979 RepID=UPI0028E54E1B|nr:diguanylate cyclase [Candidatus Methylospira mobilis]WNV03904.1 diguanylate cyclase [Candidatus Methylospira mobilis]
MPPCNPEITGKSEYRFGDLIDAPAFSRMLESFFIATGIPNGVVDADGELLSMAGGENACAVFHRAHPEAAERCCDSNKAIMRDLRERCVAGGPCRNGLMDYATPVVVEGRLLATLFLGQILHGPADKEFFRAQAARFGFDETAYLKAIAAVPIVDKARAESSMAFMVEMAQMLAASGIARLRQTALERELDAHAERRVQLEDILDFSPVAIGWSDGNDHIEYINRQFTRLFGYTLDDLPNIETWYRLACPDEHYRETVVRPWVANAALAHRSGAVQPELEAKITCKNGGVRRVLIRTSWVGSHQLVNLSDITDRWVNEQRKQAHDAMLEMVARGAALADILKAIVLQIQHEDNTALCSILLLDAEGKRLLIGAAPSLPEFYNQAVHGVEIGMGVGSCGTAAFLGQRVIVADVRIHEYWKPYIQLTERAGLQACWSEPILSSRSKVLGTFAIYHTVPKTPEQQDIERISFAANLAAIAIENRNAYEELERQAYSDYLTGLANRRHFFEQAEQELARVLRYGGELSILMLDVDHFKRANDTYGHQVGDIMLQTLSEVCRSTLRKNDIVGRIGGEEFAVLLPETGCADAMDAAERLRAALAEANVPLGNGGQPLHFTASFGVATLTGTDANIDILLNKADQALYRAKGEGRNRVCVYRE